jgi:nucleoside-diphosphate-sugar epimerase
MRSRFFCLLIINLLFTRSPIAGAPSKSVGIIGAGGFIGSELFQHLNKSPDVTVVGYDHDPQVLLNQIEKSNGRNISTHQLHKFDMVVYLGGCTGRRACAAADSDERVYASNVQTVVDLATRMTSRQTLIFASSSAVVDHRKDCAIPVTEKETDSKSLLHDIATFDTLDRYSKHMILRETALLELVQQFGKQVPKLIGLRFGTVGGVSVSQRVDLLTNAIVRAAYTKGVITGVGQDKHRPVLWLADALRAIETIIDTDNDTMDRERFRIYHLSSFNTKIGKAVMEAGRITGADVQIIAPPTPEDACGFSLDAALFCKDFNFKFLGNLAIVLENIDEHVPMSITAQGTHKKKEHHHHNHHDHHDQYCKEHRRIKNIKNTIVAIINPNPNNCNNFHGFSNHNYISAFTQ